LVKINLILSHPKIPFFHPKFLKFQLIYFYHQKYSHPANEKLTNLYFSAKIIYNLCPNKNEPIINNNQKRDSFKNINELL
jgi:hypothetical protein